MISAGFKKDDGGFFAVSVTGHAGFAPFGEDIVCASVTSAVMLVCNGITDVLFEPAEVKVLKNEISIELPRPAGEKAQMFLRALYLHFELMREQYQEYITITLSEV
jgi:uncharacterized protein YsxB (DUF464 family)